LLEAGKIFQSLYELQLHPQASSSYRKLQQLDKRLGSPKTTQNLLTLYRLNNGPIANTLENKREPFLAVDPPKTGVNVYPWGVSKQEIDAFLTANPKERDSILGLRTVVRRVERTSLQRDLMKLRQYPVLATLHPGLQQKLSKLSLKKAQKGFYAVPYSVAYADELIRVHALLNEAADVIQSDDEEFAGYLRNRSRDLLSDDYESGDAAWVTANFKHLNAEIGAYETYDDDLYGVKAFFGFSLLSMRGKETEDLRKAIKGLQSLEESLPYKNHKKVKENIPVGVYDVIADFGQARGGNTATILPNESYLARRYGRTILMRANILRDPQIFESISPRWEAAIVAEHKSEFVPAGNFYRTLWHEIGHYLGVDQTKDGKDLDQALQGNTNIMEEMKADLVSLYVAQTLHNQGYYTADQLKGLYASGINRVLQANKPRRDQPYNTMQLIQWNFFMENNLLSFDDQKRKLKIDYEKYHNVIGNLLAKVLEMQYEGNNEAVNQFIDRYTKWDEKLHGEIAKNIREHQRYRFRLFKYSVLDND
jgi:hypothetical protein